MAFWGKKNRNNECCVTETDAIQEMASRYKSWCNTRNCLPPSPPVSSFYISDGTNDTIKAVRCNGVEDEK